MQQRRPRLGDILDDYCPRERRITNHAVVAMVEDDVKQTRCSTCDTEHEYKHARVPSARRKKTGALTANPVEGGSLHPVDIHDEHEDDATTGNDPTELHIMPDGVEAEERDEQGEPDQGEPRELTAAQESSTDAADVEPMDEGPAGSDEWPVHRPLIRATLPRPEGHTPERKDPDFTFRPGGGARFDANRNGQRHRGHRPARQAHGQSSGQGQGQGQGSRFGGQRSSGQGQRGPGYGGGPQGQRPGNRSGQGQGQGGGAGRPGQGRGPRPSGGGGRKRGR